MVKIENYLHKWVKILECITQVRDSYRGRYEVVLYNKNAQIFIMDNIDKIISFANKMKRCCKRLKKGKS